MDDSISEALPFRGMEGKAPLQTSSLWGVTPHPNTTTY